MAAAERGVQAHELAAFEDLELAELEPLGLLNVENWSCFRLLPHLEALDALRTRAHHGAESSGWRAKWSSGPFFAE